MVPLVILSDVTMARVNENTTVKTGNAYTLFVGRAVAGLWVVRGLSKCSPHEGY